MNMFSEDTQNVKVVVLTTMILLTVISNFCSILAIVWRKRKISRMYYFLLHVSVADMLTAFLTLLPELINSVATPEIFATSLGCKTVKFLQMVAPYLRFVTSLVINMTSLI